jgi:hypothetical protein
MINYTRRFALFLALSVLAACTQPVLQTGGSESLVVQNVTVDVSGLSGITGRNITVPPEQIGQDVKVALEKALSRTGTQNADLAISLTAVKLTSRGSAAAFGGNSRITAILTVTDTDTKAVLVPPTEVTGYSQVVRVPGVIGVATSPTAANDYRQTVDGFALSVRDQIYGPPAAT